jgi:hypothetical protein
MSKRATVVVDLQNEYLPTRKLALCGIEQALAMLLASLPLLALMAIRLSM